MEKEYYTVKEAADLLNIIEGTVRVYLSNGTLKSEKIYNSTVISKEEIERYNKYREDNK